MDLNHLIEIFVGLVVGWVGLLEVRLRRSQTKLKEIEEKDRDEKIKSQIINMSDDELNNLLTKYLGNRDPKT